MKIELRTDSLNITGYVNVTGKFSKPVATPHGKCIEVIEERAFAESLSRNGDICVTVDHDNSKIYASTSAGTLQLREDAVGLHADVTITDENLIEIAKKGKIKGWSFGMYNVVDELEQRADNLPIRHVKSLDLDHITLVVNQTPAYSATSVECRADGEFSMEYRSLGETPDIVNKPDFSQYEQRIRDLVSNRRS